jgi:hypothetical protein
LQASLRRLGCARQLLERHLIRPADGKKSTGRTFRAR